MKFIDVPELSRLAQALTHEGPECSVHTRIEAYSCKSVKRDKKLFKSLEHAYNDEVSNSPPLPSFITVDHEPEMTPFGPIDKHASRKTLYLLIATLNIAFPDHEFSDVKPAHFSKEPSGASVLNSLSTTLVSPRAGMRAPRTYSSYPPTSNDFFPSSLPTSSSPPSSLVSPYAPPQIMSGTHPTLYRILDDVIGLPECEVFSYSPDVESDPHANDYSDEEEDVASIGDSASSEDDEEDTFAFDDYDIDNDIDKKLSHARPMPSRPSHIAGDRGDEDEDAMLPPSPLYMRRHGALLWSSHWFFLNRKLKRILFVSVWARSRGMARYEFDEGYGSAERVPTISGERFLGWEGAVGAGARAMGLSASV